MRPAIHTTTRVQPGHKIELSSPELPEGKTVEVIVVLPESNGSGTAQTRPAGTAVAPRPARPGEGLMDLLRSFPPSQRTPEEWEEYDRQFQEERDAWDR